MDANLRFPIALRDLCELSVKFRKGNQEFHAEHTEVAERKGNLNTATALMGLHGGFGLTTNEFDG